MTPLLVLALLTCSRAAGSEIAVDRIIASTVSAPSGGANIEFLSPLFTIGNVSLSESSGTVVSGSSVVAGSFDGYGAPLENIAILSGPDQSLSGANIFLSSLSVASGGRIISLSTGSTAAGISISQTGATTFSPTLHNASSTIIPNFSTTNPYCDIGVPGSTLTITTNGGRVELVFSGLVFNNPAAAGMSFLVDGAFVSNLSSASVVNRYDWHPLLVSETLRYVTDPLAKGSHSFCLTLCTNMTTNPDSFAAVLDNTSDHATIFYVKELK